MGPGTLEVPLALFQLNRKRLVEKLQPKNLGNAVVVLQGGDDIPFYDTDTQYIFRQVSFATFNNISTSWGVDMKLSASCNEKINFKIKTSNLEWPIERFWLLPPTKTVFIYRRNR